MKTILLVSANSCQDPYPVYPLGLSVVAEGLRQSGRTVFSHDVSLAPPTRTLTHILRETTPDCVGISVRNIDNVDLLSAQASWTGNAVKELVASVRSITRAPVVLGGPGFSLMADELLAHTEADFGVTGPGEQAFPALLDMLSAGITPPRILTGSVPKECHSAPAGWDGPLLESYVALGALPGLHTKRGCSFRCLYCGYPLIEGGVVRSRDPEEVADDLLQARDRFGVREFFFTDAVFNDPEGHYLEFAETLARADMGIRFSAYFNPLPLGVNNIRLLKRAGLMAIEAGTDALCDQTLKNLQKPHCLDDVLAFQDICHEHNIPCAHFLVFAGPGETWESLETGLANLDRLQGGCVFAFQGLRIHRHTGLHGLAIREGLLSPDAPLLHPTFYHSPHLDPDRTHSRIRQAFQGHRDRFFPPEDGHIRMRVLRRMGYRGLLWNTLPTFAAYETTEVGL